MPVLLESEPKMHVEDAWWGQMGVRTAGLVVAGKVREVDFGALPRGERRDKVGAHILVPRLLVLPDLGEEA